MIEIFPEEDFAPAQEKPELPKRRSIEYVGAKKEGRPVSEGRPTPVNVKKQTSDIINRYHSRFYKICLLNLAVAVVMLVIYKNTGNEDLVPAIYACVANTLITYMCID